MVAERAGTRELDLEGYLVERFGHESFRPGQKRIIQSLLRGRDVLALLPTGAGKSLVYQLTAQLLPGVTVVVSPLLALMKDQAESVAAAGFEVAVVNSAQSEGQAEAALESVKGGEAKLLYVTPERFEDTEFVAEIRRLQVSLVVVDEAHCVSEWGHSFRPAYLALDDAARELGRPTLLALTATATPWVRQDIVERLGLREPAVVVQGTDRPNLYFEVIRIEDELEDHRVLRHLLAADTGAEDDRVHARLGGFLTGCGIVYTATTKGAEETAAWLREWGIAAEHYHGQRRQADRERVHEAFMSGEVRVICATNAFGLGIDKPDIRFVIHRDVPANLEAYYQEAGRAGRDGELARCTLIYRPGDLGRAAFLGSTGQLSQEDLSDIVRALKTHPEATQRDLAESAGLSRVKLVRALELLEEHGAIRKRRGRFRLVDPSFEPGAIALDREEQRRAYERSRLDMIRAYAESPECRRRQILNYFGEEYEPRRCELCDNCLRSVELVPGVVGAAAPFRVNDQVAHATWGAGLVQGVSGDTVTVLFEEVGYKTLSTELVVEQELLKSIGGVS